MRFVIIFGVTLILSLLILFYNPYLGVYKNTITIDYSDISDGSFSWSFIKNNDCIELYNESENKWVFVPKNNGKSTLTFYYQNQSDVKYKIIYDFKIKNNKIYWLNGEGYGLLSYPNPY